MEQKGPDLELGGPTVQIDTESHIGQGLSYDVVEKQSFVRKQPNVATIDASNVEYVRLDNTGATNITGIKGGQDGKTLRILGDGFSTVVNNSAVTKPAEPILTNTGANKLLAANKVYRFTRFLNAGDPKNGTWYEDA